MGGKRVAIVLALMASVLVSGVPAPRPSPVNFAADRKALTAKLKSRADEWLNARTKKLIVTECNVCRGNGFVGGQKCAKCKGKATIFAEAKVKKVLLDFLSPAYRTRPHAKEVLENQYDALMAGNGPDIVLTSFRSVRPFMVDDTHGTVEVIENSSTGEVTKVHKWILISTGKNSTEWDLWTKEVDGPWPDHPVPEAEPAPVQKPVVAAPPAEPPKKAAPVVAPKAVPAAAPTLAARGSLLTVPVPKAALPFDPADSAGLFVGVRKFVSPRSGAPSDIWEDVDFAVDDAIDLAHAFSIEKGLIVPKRVHLSLSGDPQKPESVTRLQELRNAGATVEPATFTALTEKIQIVSNTAGPGGLLVMTFATHGSHTDEGDDCIYAQDSISGKTSTGLTARQVKEQTETSEAPRKILLFDSCRELMVHSRGGGSAAPMSPTFAKTLGELRGTAVLFASAVGGFSYDDQEAKNGVFTRAFLDGLHGKAQANAQGYITLGAIATYANNEVKDWTREHRSTSGPPRNIERYTSEDVENLPLAEYRGPPKDAAPKSDAAPH